MFSLTRNQLIIAALDTLELKGRGRTVSSEDINRCVIPLNALVLEYQTEGLHLWVQTQAILFLTVGQSRYEIQGSLGDRAADVDNTVVTHSLSTTNTGAIVIEVATTEGMATDDEIGIVMTNQKAHWSLILTVDDLTHVTITVPLPSDSASNSLVTTFSKRMDKPLRVTSVRRVALANISPSEITMTSLSRTDYFDLPGKQLPSDLPTQWYFEPRREKGVFYLWLTPASATTYLRFTYTRAFTSLLEANSTFDFPSEWYNTLILNCAVRVAPLFGKYKIMAVLQPAADRSYAKAISWDKEITPIYLNFSLSTDRESPPDWGKR